ncbi:MAG TPA: NGG1p interacting factor NIF3, partial [Coriobacteriia bacterium]|nr:NGG1p interacting factor NIF3 [Coriobacteriia bacterium]
MRLAEMYRAAVEKGMREDARSPEELQQVLRAARKEYDKLDEVDKEFFDRERFENPYSDTRICVGDPDQEIR